MGRPSTKMKANLSQAPTVHIRKFFQEARKNKARGANKGAKTNRLYCKAVVMGYKRSLRGQSTNTNLLKIQGVEDTQSTDFYLGKKVLYMYRAKTERNGTFMRTVWGKVTRSPVPAELCVPSLPPTC